MNGKPPSSSAALSSSFDFWIWAETANATKLISSQTPAAIATQLRTLPPGRLLARGPRLRAAPARSRSRSEGPSPGALEAAARLVDGVAGPLRRARSSLASSPEPAGGSERFGSARRPRPRDRRAGPVDVVFGAIRTFGVAGCHYAVILPHGLPVSCFVTAPDPAPARPRDDRRRPRRHEDARRRRRRRGARSCTGGSTHRSG